MGARAAGSRERSRFSVGTAPRRVGFFRPSVLNMTAGRQRGTGNHLGARGMSGHGRQDDGTNERAVQHISVAE
jgi:hypothetical protein